MNMSRIAGKAARALTPPILWKAWSRLGRGAPRGDGTDVSFAGDYASWDAAARASTGYDAREILSKTMTAARKVRDGAAAFERDSVTFDTPSPPFPLLAALLRAAAAENRLSVVDFGGALGSSYHQCRRFLDTIGRVRWNVVEQPHYVEAGRAEFANAELRFFRSVEDCLAVEPVRPNVLLFSSVLQYLPAPYETLEGLLRHRIPHVVVDRTAFVGGDRERLTVQTVPPSIYEASYPAWFLCERRLVGAFERGGYGLVADFDAIDFATLPDAQVYYKGMIFALNADAHRTGGAGG